MLLSLWGCTFNDDHYEKNFLKTPLMIDFGLFYKNGLGLMQQYSQSVLHLKCKNITFMLGSVRSL